MEIVSQNHYAAGREGRKRPLTCGIPESETAREERSSYYRSGNSLDAFGIPFGLVTAPENFGGIHPAIPLTSRKAVCAARCHWRIDPRATRSERTSARSRNQLISPSHSE